MERPRTTTTRGGVTLLAAMCALSLGIGACSRDNDDKTSTGGTSAATAAPGTSGPGGTTADTSPARPDETIQPGGIDTMPGADTATKSAGFTGDTTTNIPLLTAVRVARQEGFDRIVFEFEGDKVPGYEVGYINPPITEDASGNTVTVAGSAYLQIKMQPSGTADLSTAELRPTYTGPTRFSPGTPEVQELVKTGDFEAVLTWVAGLTDKVDFRVSTLTGPARVVIDVRNH